MVCSTRLMSPPRPTHARQAHPRPVEHQHQQNGPRGARPSPRKRHRSRLSRADRGWGRRCSHTQHRKAREFVRRAHRAHDGLQDMQAVGERRTAGERQQPDLAQQFSALRRERRHGCGRRQHDLEAHRARGVGALAEPRLLIALEERGVLRLVHVVIAVQLLEFGLDLRRTVEARLQVRDRGLVLRELLAQRGDLDVHLVQLELHALVDRIVAGAACGHRGRIAPPQALELGGAPLLELLERGAGGDHVRVLIGVLQE